MIKKRRALTLVELLVGIILIGVVISALTTAYLFVGRQIIEGIRRQNMFLQINYAVENMRLHCLSAVNVDNGSYFPPNDGSHLRILGEIDIYDIHPEEPTIVPEPGATKVWYEFLVDANGNIVLRTFNANPTEEILVDRQYHPTLLFMHREGDEPNFLTVTVTATWPPNNIRVERTEGIRFWFADVVR